MICYPDISNSVQVLYNEKVQRIVVYAKEKCTIFILLCTAIRTKSQENHTNRLKKIAELDSRNQGILLTMKIL